MCVHICTCTSIFTVFHCNDRRQKNTNLNTVYVLQMFTLRPLTIVLPSREDKDHPAIDLDLHLPFFCFRPQQLLQVLDTPLLCQCWWNRLTVTLMSLFSLCPFFCPRLCRCYLVCCRNSGLCYFLLIGPDSHWLQSACCFFCRSVGIFKLLLLNLTYNKYIRFTFIKSKYLYPFCVISLKHWL